MNPILPNDITIELSDIQGAFLETLLKYHLEGHLTLRDSNIDDINEILTHSRYNEAHQNYLRALRTGLLSLDSEWKTNLLNHMISIYKNNKNAI